MKYSFDEVIDRENTDSYKYDLRERYFGTEDLLPMWVADMDFRELEMSIEEQRGFFIHKARVGFSEGALFGPGGEGFQRMNIAYPRSIIKEALDRINTALIRL